MQAASTPVQPQHVERRRDQAPAPPRSCSRGGCRDRRSSSRGCRPGRRRGGCWRAPARRPARCPRRGTGRTDRPDRSACPRHSAAAAGERPAGSDRRPARSAPTASGTCGLSRAAPPRRRKSVICGPRSTTPSPAIGGSGSGALSVRNNAMGGLQAARRLRLSTIVAAPSSPLPGPSAAIAGRARAISAVPAARVLSTVTLSIRATISSIGSGRP